METGDDKQKYEYTPTSGTETPKDGGEEKSGPSKDVQETRPRKKRRKELLAALVIVAVFAIGFFLAGSPMTGFFTAAGARGGDTVAVLYTGTLEDGTVFDTNVQERAAQAGIERSSFEPLVFTLGKGQVVPGFEEAVLGMHAGETKTVTIPPSQAYGEPDPARIYTVPRSKRFNRTENILLATTIPAEQFLTMFGIIENGATFTAPGTNLTYEKLNVTNGTVFARLLLTAGETLRFPRTAWNSTVLKIDGDTATVRNIPGETTITTEFGQTTIAYGEDTITITANPAVGDSVTIPNPLTGRGMPGKVTAVDGENMTIDFNNKLAGKSLTFEIELVNITQ